MSVGERKDRVKARSEAPNSSIRQHLSLIASKSRLGRVKQAVRREFILSNGRPITARQVLARAYPRLKRFIPWACSAAVWCCRRSQSLWSRPSELMASSLALTLSNSIASCLPGE
jgi:hypothetical protein